MLDPRVYKKKVANNLITMYGGEKIGKSTSLWTLFDVEPSQPIPKVYIIDVDHGLEPLMNKLEKMERWDEIRKTTEVVVVNSKDEFYDAVWNMPQGFDYYVPAETMSRAAKFFIHAAQPKTFRETGKRRGNLHINATVAFFLEDYIDRIEEQAWRFKKANDAWTIITCHQKDITVVVAKTEEIDEEVAAVIPLIYGSAGNKLDRVSTCILHMEITKKQTPQGWKFGRRFRTEQTDQIVAGDRTGALNKTEPANFTKLISKIRVHRGEKSKGHENTN